MSGNQSNVHFQPFPDGSGGHYDEFQNTSHLVTRYLPSSLPVGHILNPTLLPIRILNPTAPNGKYVPSEYAQIRRFVREMWDEHGQELDLVLHLGMADGWEWFTIEGYAFKEGFTSDFDSSTRHQEGYYHILDDAGKTVSDITKSEGKGVWDALPVGLAPNINVDQAVQDATRLLKKEDADRTSVPASERNPDVIAHHEAGDYCCGFIYYESLANCKTRGVDTRVVFTHVPGWRDSKRLEGGSHAVCAIIGSVCLQISKQETHIR